MRSRELLDEDYNKNLESDLNNLLIGAIGAGSTEINTRNLVQQMQNMGYSVDEINIIPLLNNNSSVLNATSTIIRLAGGEDMDHGNTSSNDAAARVGDMAQQATHIS